MPLWRVLSVAFALFLSSAVYAQQPAPEGEPISAVAPENRGAASQDGAKAYLDNAAEILSALLGIQTAIRDLISEDDEIERRADRERDKSDLEAQQRMALWAKFMFWATAATVLLTLAGLLLIWRTLVHTRRAAIHAGEAVAEAKLATKAAQDAVEVTRDIGQAQVRAYATVHSVQIKVEDGQYKVRFLYGNSGQTPARDAFLGVSIAVVEGPRNPSRWGGGSSMRHGDWPANQSDLEWEGFPGNTSVIVHDPHKSVAIHLLIRVNLVDVFGKNHRQTVQYWEPHPYTLGDQYVAMHIAPTFDQSA